MKMRMLLSALVLCCLTATGAFAQKGKMTPIEYNDKLASITDSLYNLGVEWGTEFQRIAAADKNYSALSAKRKKISSFTTRQIEEVRKSPIAGKGAENLKSAMLNFLTFEKNMVEQAFAPIEKLSSASTQAEIDAAIEKLTKESEQEGTALKKVNEAQESFAKQNDFSIEAADAESAD